MSAGETRIETVFFDVGGTSLRVERGVGVVYAETAADHGIEVDPTALDAAFRAAWKRSLERSRARQHRCSDPILREEWLEIVRETFGDAVPRGALGALFEDLYERFVSRRAWRIAPGLLETLAHLRRRGIRLGILSNWDSRLERLLVDLDLACAFDMVIVSHAVGYEKPHARIFEEALRRAGCAAGRCLHVGDSYPADIAPARALGLNTLWLAPGPEREQRPDAGPGLERFPEDPAEYWDPVLSGSPRAADGAA